MPSRAAQGRPAKRLGAYLLGPRIGAGGMAVVDAAYHLGPAGGRLVALKRMAASFSNEPTARRLFLREASIVTRLEHPNVVRTYEVGEADGETFIAMELLEGATIAQLQRSFDGPVPLPITLRIVRDALRGLHAAHELCAPGGRPLGVVHQDVSPQNIHVAYEGTTRVLDFGVARLSGVETSRTNAVRGKPCYLAPEQLALQPVDRRADIFAMGIVLHELLTGASLFPREHAEAAYAAILMGSIPPPGAMRADIPSEIDSVVRRALSRLPADRFATAEDMRIALAIAQEAAGIPDVDAGSVGDWVRRVVSPSWTRNALEMEVTSNPSGAPAGQASSFASDDDIHSARTIGPTPAHGRGPSKLRLGLLLVALLATGAASIALPQLRPRLRSAPGETDGIERDLLEPSPSWAVVPMDRAPSTPSQPSGPSGPRGSPAERAPAPIERKASPILPAPSAPVASAPAPPVPPPRRTNVYEEM